MEYSPRATSERPEGRVILRSGKPNEAEGCSQEPSALVEHGLLDDLVGSDQQRLRDGEAQSLRRLQIDQELEFSWLLYGKVSGLRTFQNSIHVVRCALVYGRKACPVGNEASGLNKVLVQRDHGQP